MAPARKKKAYLIPLVCLLVLGGFFILPHNTSYAETTMYKSANIVTTNGSPQYTNLSNCSTTDSNTCDRAQASSYGDLYFRDFGNFNIPDGSTITNIRLRVTGKTNVPVLAPFIALSRIGPSTNSLFYESCQSPSDRWRMYTLNSATIKTYNVTTSTTNGYLATCLSPLNIKTNNFIFSIHYSHSNAWYANIDNFEVAFDYIPPATPPPPQPFLDLPWDYEAKGQTFADAALSMSSYFDHSYPLLSSGLFEPNSSLNQITTFKNENSTTKNYSSHDGYDYAIGASVRLGDPVLAAAAGTAEYVNSCTPCGNMILINHGNGYQTRYLHMQKDGLIVSTPGVKVNVSSHQQIGKVGASGNVSPAGDAGAHIHFGVFQDKNNDGDFYDNVPDGATDPFGWQSSEPDPWEDYSFLYNGLQRTGNKSHYLWKKSLGATSETLSPSGGNVSSNRYFLSFPSNSVSQNINIELIPESIFSPSNILSSIGPTLLALATDQLGNPITDFLNPFTLIVDFANFDLSRFNLSSLSIYSSQDGITWNKEPTTIDLTNEKASTSLSHFTHFALMAERLDSTPPLTQAILSGDKGEDNWYHSDTSLLLNALDNQGGLGVDYTVFAKEGMGADIYSLPIIATEEGHFKYEFYSVDKDGNIEDKKTIEFNIDKTPPIISFNTTIDGNPYTLGTWTNIDVRVTFSCTDSLSGVLSVTETTLMQSEGENQSITGECKDKAGNVAAVQVTGINIDKTPPIISISADPSIIWAPNGKLVPIRISGFIQELHIANKTFNIIDEYGITIPLLNEFGDTIFLEARRNDRDFDGRIYTIIVDAIDLAGNESSAQAQIIVPHDQSKK